MALFLLYRSTNLINQIVTWQQKQVNIRTPGQFFFLFFIFWQNTQTSLLLGIQPASIKIVESTESIHLSFSFIRVIHSEIFLMEFSSKRRNEALSTVPRCLRFLSSRRSEVPRSLIHQRCVCVCVYKYVNGCCLTSQN